MGNEGLAWQLKFWYMWSCPFSWMSYFMTKYPSVSILVAGSWNRSIFLCIYFKHNVWWYSELYTWSILVLMGGRRGWLEAIFKHSRHFIPMGKNINKQMGMIFAKPKVVFKCFLLLHASISPKVLNSVYSLPLMWNSPPSPLLPKTWLRWVQTFEPHADCQYDFVWK